jgi:hypothetical protein
VPDDQKPIRDVIKRQSDRVDASILAFRRDLDTVLLRAELLLEHRLIRLLKIDADGQIAAVPANQRLLRRLPLLWQDALDGAGLESVIDAYARTFPAPAPSFQEVLFAINATAKNPLPLPDFSNADIAYLESVKLSSMADIAATVEAVGQAAKSKTLFSLGGLGLKELTKILEDRAGVAADQAFTLADTSLMMYYRIVNSIGFQRIQGRVLPDLRFVYVNPVDAVTRVFCLRLMRLVAQGKSWTREEINKMDNGQLPNVFCSCGGYRCRGAWMIQV